MTFIITLDIGTSSLRAIIYDSKGRYYFSSQKEYHTEFIYPAMVEQNPDDWYNAAIDTLTEAAAFAAKNNIKPQAIAITSQRASLIPADKKGEPLRRAVMWQDKRTIQECDELQALMSMESLYRKTGLRVNPYAVLPRILWLKKNQPEIFRKAYKLLGVQDYITYKLTGEFKTDWTQAARTMLMDIRKFEWDHELLEIAGLCEGKLCELVPPGSVAGGLTREIAMKTGLLTGLPIILCGGDQQNAAVALGVVAPGKAEANTGTGSFIIVYTEKPEFEKECRVICSASAIPGKWILEAGIFNTGAIFRWFKEQFCKDFELESMPYRIMDEQAKTSPPGSNGVMLLPHFEGSGAPYWEPMAKGVFFNLSLGTTRQDMIRAILEGITMEITDNIELLKTIGGEIDRVSIAGGMAKSDIFAQIQADMFNIPVVRFKNSEASSLGAAMSAMTSLGVYGTIEEAAAGMLENDPHKFFPDSDKTPLYSAMLKRRRKLFSSLLQQRVYDEFMSAF